MCYLKVREVVMLLKAPLLCRMQESRLRDSALDLFRPIQLMRRVAVSRTFKEVGRACKCLLWRSMWLICERESNRHVMGVLALAPGGGQSHLHTTVNHASACLSHACLYKTHNPAVKSSYASFKTELVKLVISWKCWVWAGQPASAGSLSEQFWNIAWAGQTCYQLFQNIASVVFFSREVFQMHFAHPRWTHSCASDTDPAVLYRAATLTPIFYFINAHLSMLSYSWQCDAHLDNQDLMYCNILVIFPCLRIFHMCCWISWSHYIWLFIHVLWMPLGALCFNNVVQCGQIFILKLTFCCHSIAYPTPHVCVCVSVCVHVSTHARVFAYVLELMWIWQCLRTVVLLCVSLLLSEYSRCVGPICFTRRVIYLHITVCAEERAGLHWGRPPFPQCSSCTYC